MQKDHEDFKQPLSKVNNRKNTTVTVAIQLCILLLSMFWTRDNRLRPAETINLLDTFSLQSSRHIWTRKFEDPETEASCVSKAWKVRYKSEVQDMMKG